MEHFQLNIFMEAYELEKVRSSIFTITGVCAGLPALVWSVSDLIHHRKNGHRISIFIILLLLTDFIELFLSPYILIKTFVKEIPPCKDCKIPFCKDWTCCVFVSLWSSLRVCGFLLNQLVALEGILSVKCPFIFSSRMYIMFFILVIVCVIIGQFILHHIYTALLVFSASLILMIISCRASCCPDQHSHKFRKPDRHVMVVFIFSVLVIYLYLALLCSVFVFIPSSYTFLFYWIDPFFLTSLRLISDPLLCVLVWRQNLSLQTSQTPEGKV